MSVFSRHSSTGGGLAPCARPLIGKPVSVSPPAVPAPRVFGGLPCRYLLNCVLTIFSAGSAYSTRRREGTYSFSKLNSVVCACIRLPTVFGVLTNGLLWRFFVVTKDGLHGHLRA